jgi:GntR family transcriptional regulator/MocR family aminotransferase
VRKLPDQRVGKEFDLGAPNAGPGVSLTPSIPAVDEFPIDVWERLRAQVLAKKGAHLLRYASNRGDADLRKAIAAYLCDFRGARCHPDQIVIVGGMQQAMLISAMALINRGEVAWIEDPGCGNYIQNGEIVSSNTSITSWGIVSLCRLRKPD